MCDKVSKQQHRAKKARVDPCRTLPRINDVLRAKICASLQPWSVFGGGG